MLYNQYVEISEVALKLNKKHILHKMLFIKLENKLGDIEHCLFSFVYYLKIFHIF